MCLTEVNGKATRGLSGMVGKSEEDFQARRTGFMSQVWHLLCNSPGCWAREQCLETIDIQAHHVGTERDSFDRC